MPRNVEVKARISDAAALRAQVLAAGASGPERLDQDDVFFAVPCGRLKLRVLGPERGELIAYHRRDSAAATGSTYHLTRTDRPDALLETLSAVLPVRGHVLKCREVYRLGRTRIHVDQVEGLGEFVELEVVLAEGEPEANGAAIADDLCRRFGISASDRVAAAYIDLLETGGRP